MSCQVSAAGRGASGPRAPALPPVGAFSVPAAEASGGAACSRRGSTLAYRSVSSPCRPQVTVLYFARSAELVGLRSESVSVPQRITSLQLWEEIVKIHPRYRGRRCVQPVLTV